MRRIVLTGALGLALALSGGALAGKVGLVKPWVYDPNGTGLATAEWTKDGLLLDNNAQTGVVATGAVVKGVAGEPLTSLSFERKADTYCGAGSPRFSVRFEGESAYRFFTCLYGRKAPGSKEGWEKVTFSDETPYCDGGSAAPTGCFGDGKAVEAIFLVHDEGPSEALLDRIEVNGVVVSRHPS
ncbi:MAG TPA: hypothetical protein VNJ46_06820 [Gaiellaceae bacterium]|nr:hypothetical protein [Gaiellaceae bacterium]